MLPSSSVRDLGSVAPEAPVDLETERGWGIGSIWWLWTTRIRILFVIDGRITTGHGDQEFGLGPVIDTLRDRSFAWWVRFTVEVADRDDGFRFTQDGFDIDDYDQVWFFGDWPGIDANDPAVGDDAIDNHGYAPLDDAELKIVAEWMDRGGGVFATGDHSLLGASMCSRIPRVRTMRKWTRAQGVPAFTGPERHQTLVRTPGGDYQSWEGDRWPQPIAPVYRHDARHPFVFGLTPHPLLCGSAGVIDRFPDHMHEGSVLEDHDVELDLPLGIPGYSGVEYPAVQQVAIPAAAPPHLGLPAFPWRPVPEVIAHGWTTHGTAAKRFALVGVYDGDPVEVGRVVVDSTWHHWFSMNLVGFRDEAPHLYRGMQDYYRNVALWLATPAQRRLMLFAAVWGSLVGVQPGLFSRVLGIWDVGARVVDVIGRAAPQCLVSELVATFLASAAPLGGVPAGAVGPSAETVNQAVIGGIAMEMLEVSERLINERARGHTPELDIAAVVERGAAGVVLGRRTLREVLARSVADLEALGVLLDDDDVDTGARSGSGQYAEEAEPPS